MNRVGSTSPAGLTDEEASRRLADDGPNELPDSAPRGLLHQAWDVVTEPMLLLLVTAATVNFVLAEPLDGTILASFVVVVIGISIAQEHKTEHALAALRDLSSPRALVIRSGRKTRIAGRAVVRGDLVLLAEGDRIPADAVLVDSMNFSVDESALTGESVPVRKTASTGAETADMGPPGGDATPWVFSGTLVVKGHGVAVVARTGSRTELGRIGQALSTIEPERTALQREVDRLVRRIAVLAVAVALVVVVIDALTRDGWLEAVLVGIATAMAMLPEEFPVVLTVFLAIGAWRMSQRHVLTRRPAVIETLGATTVLGVDKTGTLTMNSMTVQELEVDGRAYAIGDGAIPEDFHEVLEFAVLASPIDAFDPMDRAFTTLGDRTLAGTEHLHRDWQLVREYPLSDELLALSHVWRSPDSTRFVVAAKGAPEAIADLCHLDPVQTGELAERVAAATRRGLRVLAVARARFGATDALPSGQHDFEFELLGLAALADPVRPGVAASVAECTNAGVRTVMITGDHPNTALAIAAEIGLDCSAGCVTGPELAAVHDDEWAGRIAGVNVFARMVPAQKLQLVRALQANGEVVGMTGDGVNDAPALRAADVGIAMGARGTDVAREAAALVITDDDFASIVGGVRRGRGIYDNLRKAMAYIIAVHVPIVGMSLVPLLVHDWPLVLLPVQIALLELIIDPACSVVFDAEEIDPLIMDQPPRDPAAPMFGRHVLWTAVLQGLGVLAAVLAVYLWAVTRHLPAGEVRSLTFVALVAGNLGLILVNRSWRLSVMQTFAQRRNPALKWMLPVAVTLLTVLLTVPGLRRAFGFGAVQPLHVVGAVLTTIVGLAWFEVAKVVRQRRPDPTVR